MYNALFVATVIEMDKYRWAYGRKWRPERMIKSTIRLPAKLKDDKSGVLLHMDMLIIMILRPIQR